jgi:hypothetical protein
MAWAPSYATAAQLRQYMRQDAVTGDATDIAQDTLVNTPAVAAASRAIDRACGRQFGSVTPVAARYYTASYSTERGRYMVAVDDIYDLTGLTVFGDLDGSGTYATSITVKYSLPKNAIAIGKVVTDLALDNGTTSPGAIKVTALWGWTAVPATILAATLLQASRIASRRDSPYGVAGSPELGSELRLLSKLDPDVAIMVSAYRRYW